MLTLIALLTIFAKAIFAWRGWKQAAAVFPPRREDDHGRLFGTQLSCHYRLRKRQTFACPVAVPKFHLWPSPSEQVDNGRC